MKRIAIVILNWNGAEMLRRYLPSVVEFSSGLARIIVADNDSSDGSLHLLKESFPQVEILRLDMNYGFAEGYNRALKQISSEFYLLLNSDVRVGEGWLSPLLDFMDQHQEVAACQPKLRSMSHPEQFEYAGAAGGMLDKLGYPFCRGRIFSDVEADEGQYDDPCQVDWGSGACLLVRSKDYWCAGGLDRRFFAHNEEIDLCWRLRIMGRQIWSVPASVVWHVGGGTLPKSNPMKTYLNFRNNLTMLYKNLPDRHLGSVLRCRCVLDWLAAFATLLLNRNFGDFKAIIRARRDFKQWKHEFDADRMKIQQCRKENARQELRPYSILWNYYFRHCRKYSDLQ